jgi:hypothetical protein
MTHHIHVGDEQQSILDGAAVEALQPTQAEHAEHKRVHRDKAVSGFLYLRALGKRLVLDGGIAML